MEQLRNKEVNLRNMLSGILLGVYFFSLIIYLGFPVNILIYLSILSCILIIIINNNNAEYIISTYLGIFVITLTTQTNYLIPFTIINFFILIFFYRKKIIKSISKPVLLLILLVCCIAISIVNSINLKLAIDGLTSYFIATLIFFNIAFLARRKLDLSNLYWLFTFFIFTMLFVFFYSHSISELSQTHRALIYFIGDSGTRSNTLAGYLAALIFICFGSFKLNKSYFKKIVSLICMGAIILMMYFFISRGAYLGMLVAIIPLLIIKVSRTRFLLINFLIIIGLISISFSNLAENRIFNLSKEDYSNGRIEYYTLALEQLKLHPLIGNGMNQFGFLAGMNKLEDPHNWLLAYLSAIGLVGTIIFLFFIYYIVKTIFLVNLRETKSNKELLVMAQAVSVPIVHGMVEPTMSTSLPFMFFCILAAVLYGNYFKPNKRLNSF
ncbi:O-antigen ligase family protein [Psychrobacillus sp. MER TA 171]|uniref:O-antigen ligase family protein n=1 Tax=Psychrobacillus sp. MER TA 171 TaxID=2939577 RepID=UPI00203D05A4|nr:O-antigen ligase family protein [Psychrobacillus sp. MER TA 171]MCM3356561.1 O-antigen ligase family protein [Psychrobacillus sp. MER TA 171]